MLRVTQPQTEPLKAKVQESVKEAVFGDADAETSWLWTQHASNSLFSLNGRERNMLFLNQGSSFERLGATSGADDVTDGRSFVSLDFDDDGDLDLIVKNLQKRTLHVLRNDVETRNHRVAFRLVGKSGSRDAIGARVVLNAGGKTRTKQIRSASGFLSQSPTEVFFGLESTATIDSVEVHWPRGEVQTFTGLGVDRRYRLVEGEAAEELLRFPTQNNRALTADPYPTNNSPVGSATDVRPMPDMPSEPLNPAARSGFPRTGRPLLVSFLTSWCASCREDIALMRQMWALPNRPFDIAVVQVIEPEFPERELNVAELPFPVFKGNRGMLLRWRQSLAFVVPTSFWVAPNGNIVGTYTGRLDGRQILRDFQLLNR